ncbi:DUF664 domain-containing protein [bacterium]|nr:DUF664 domain-containing protein [bacterium]
MGSDLLSNLDFTRREQPAADTGTREQLTEWLAYQRHEFQRKLRGLTPAGLVQWSIPPVELSVLGLVRHMTQMEHGYLSWGLGGGDRVDYYGDDDYAGGSVEIIDTDLRRYFDEVGKVDAAMAALPTIDAVGAGHGRPLGATLIKMIDEYALHSGQAHMLRFAALGEIIR